MEVKSKMSKKEEKSIVDYPIVNGMPIDNEGARYLAMPIHIGPLEITTYTMTIGKTIFVAKTSCNKPHKDRLIQTWINGEPWKEFTLQCESEPEEALAVVMAGIIKGWRAPDNEGEG